MAKSNLWEVNVSWYLAQKGVHEPWIAEISPAQYGMMSQRQRDAYDKKRSSEWDASTTCKQEYTQLLVEAYERGEWSEDTPEASNDAKERLRWELSRRADEAKKAREAEAYRNNRIIDIAQIKEGDRVFSIMRRAYAVVVKKFKARAKIRFEDGEEWTERPLALHWKSYDDCKAGA